MGKSKTPFYSTGESWYLNSEILDKPTVVYEYITDRSGYCRKCSRCGKPIRNTMYVVCDYATGEQELYLDTKCLSMYL